MMPPPLFHPERLASFCLIYPTSSSSSHALSPSGATGSQQLEYQPVEFFLFFYFFCGGEVVSGDK